MTFEVKEESQKQEKGLEKYREYLVHDKNVSVSDHIVSRSIQI